ncbi:elongation factor P 5-aminopentanone reductase [Thermoflavimicrobium dichotomicum]|uniref:3-oxoacyl-[acyl-carrier protein] reductase n=1 Tax=Thermoflavimicrobium dichotomicum TaxID=46223 RepID=A0A1I3PSY1_9BACL|nr:3-oxoacyl-ACP reductase FabG [Thermoflavimicrobium dichotomicum]SFJ24490.1 3-oxoacyl-[acyl-carrier protein] reductase [Thermoflavimicrobium dichotomicum]
MKPLAGHTAWITGASGGIGGSIAITLAEAGANIAVGYFKGKQQAEKIVQDCQKRGIHAFAVKIDVTDFSSMHEAYQQIRYAMGAPTLLIHSAGISQVGLFQDVTEKQYEKVMDTHVRGAFHLIQLGLPYLLQQKNGRIILLSSIWGETGGAGEVLYSAAKGAINGMTKALAKELAPSGITVNAVAPGAIQTPMLEKQLTPGEQEELAEEIPMGRLGMPEEVGSLVRYLCLPEASYITGQIIHINGGWYT